MLRILIIEDDPALAGLINRFLSPLTLAKPVIAYNMEEAMKIIDTVNPLDLVTLDLGLPDSSSEETLKKSIREIKAKQPNCLLVVVTGATKPEFEKEAMAQGADGFMIKQDTCSSDRTFLQTLKDVLKSIAKQPERYQKNLPLLERVTEKICDVSKTNP